MVEPVNGYECLFVSAPGVCSGETGSSELSVGEWVLVGGLRVGVEVLDDERTSTPAIFKDLDNVPPYLLLLCVA